ncbi:MAG: hypothetical protein LBS65_02570 [Desulfovibrio sp.]|jgi:predicted hotdog family 3-hydroxylacyl-ACP dehydratase|nr:hypothetical protein [Desulfovibrio sp.]
MTEEPGQRGFFEKAAAFPMPAGPFLPHAPPMLCLDRLICVSETAAEAEVVLAPGHILLHEGLLCDAGHVELAAQTAGAMKGYMKSCAEGDAAGSAKTSPGLGFLAAAQDFSVMGKARAGDTLRVRVSLRAEVAGVRLLEAEIRRLPAGAPPEILARGKLKVVVPEDIPGISAG